MGFSRLRLGRLDDLVRSWLSAAREIIDRGDGVVPPGFHRQTSSLIAALSPVFQGSDFSPLRKLEILNPGDPPSPDDLEVILWEGIDLADEFRTGLWFFRRG